MIKPQISLTWINTKKKRTDSVAPIVEPIPAEYVEVAKEVLHSTVENTEAAVNRLGLKAVIGATIVGTAIVVLHTGGVILANALDHRTTEQS